MNKNGLMHKMGFVLLTLLLFNSCKLSYRVLLGVDAKPKFYPNEYIHRQAHRWGIEDPQLYYWSREGFFAYAEERYKRAHREVQALEAADSTRKKMIKKGAKDDTQPVQIRMFDKDGGPLFKLVNCYIDPPIPLNWNKHGSFDTFPLQPHPDIAPMHHDSLQTFLPYIYSEKSDSVQMDRLPDADYYIMVFWNKYFLRPSRKLINEVQRYVKKREEDIAVLYVSNHNATLWAHATDDQKEMVRDTFEKEDEELPR